MAYTETSAPCVARILAGSPAAILAAMASKGRRFAGRAVLLALTGSRHPGHERRSGSARHGRLARVQGVARGELRSGRREQHSALWTVAGVGAVCAGGEVSAGLHVLVGG